MDETSSEATTRTNESERERPSVIVPSDVEGVRRIATTHPQIVLGVLAYWSRSSE